MNTGAKRGGSFQRILAGAGGLMLAVVLLFSSLMGTASAAPEYADPPGVTFIGNGPLWTSVDGRYVTFASSYDYMNDGLGGGQFMRDRQTQALTRVTALDPNVASITDVTPDRHYGVLYTSLSLVPQDTNGNVFDVYLVDFTDNSYELISQSSSGALGNSDSLLTAFDRTISDDGRYVTFYSSATTLTSHNYAGTADYHMFIRDRVAQTTSLLSSNSSGNPGNGNSYEGVLSKDGQTVAYVTAATDIVSSLGSTHIVYQNIAAGTKVRASAPQGVAEDPQNNGGCDFVSLSGDGRYVTMGCYAGLLPAAEPLGANAYRYDTQTGSLLLIDTGPASESVNNVRISADGRRVVFNQGAQRKTYAWDSVSQAVTLIAQNTQAPVLSENGLVLAAQELGGVPNSRSGIWTLPPITQPDTTPPTVTGTPVIQPNGNGWYNSNVTVNWTATDPSPSSGTPTQPAPTTASLEGTNTYTSAPSCDPAGNCATGSVILKIDKSAPTTTNLAMSGLITFTIPIINLTISFFPANVQTTTITATVADSVSSVVAAEYYFDNGAHVPMNVANGTASANASITGLSPGQHTLNVRSQDAAGNWSIVATRTFLK
jgi:hypothetical protein